MRDRASDLRAIADGRLMLNVRNGVTVSRSMLARIADEIDALRAASPVSEAEQRIASLEAALRMPDADRRLWFISDCLARHLHFNRSDICKAFGVSVPQASKDIKRWLELHPGAVTYNKSSKRYEAALPAVPSKGEQAMEAARRALEGGREDG